MQHVEPATFSANLVVLTKEGGRWAALVERLRQLGAQVVTTEEFEGRCLTHQDLALVDVGWVCASGRDLSLVIEDLAHSSRTPVVALTDRGATAEIARALDAGACEFIDDSDDLDLAVLRTRFAQRAHVGRRSARAGHYDDSHETPGLPTRARFVSALASAIERARLEQRHAVVLCLDVGRFRHLLGSLPPCDADELVLAVAQRMRMIVRESDLLSCGVRLLDEEDIARVGGEEFSLLLEGLEHLEDAARIGHRLVQALARPFHLSGAELCLSMSVGIASYPSDGASAETLLKAAQTAALCSRQVGSDAVQFYSPMMNARAFERSTLESALRLAIERNELLLHYQPRISIADGRTVALEALVRWQHPQLGFVPPAHFIPLAEETGLIVELGEYVLERACAQNREWRRRGFAPVRVAVNVSPVQFRHPDLFASVLRTLSRTGLEPSGLELEITESGLMHGFEEASNTLRRFKETGIEISIDDFGTGWSSLSYLRKFPVDALKIDQSFLREVTTNQEDASIVTAIVLMGKSLKLRVVAEGVETPGQLAFLRIMQCDEAQGFFLSRPLPAAEVERFLRAPLSIAA